MALTQGFPVNDAPISDENGNLSLIWVRFFTALWTRTGGSSGNNSATFNYPETNGNSGQVLTSQGLTKPSIWTNVLTKLSQFTNDAGFITSSALTGFTTLNDTRRFVAQETSSNVPLPDTQNGQAGVSDKLSRADHVHPTQSDPFFHSVSADTVFSGAASWTSGSGNPSGSRSSGSLYSNTSGGLGQRLFVSDGNAWRAVPGV